MENAELVIDWEKNLAAQPKILYDFDPSENVEMMQIEMKRGSPGVEKHLTYIAILSQMLKNSQGIDPITFKYITHEVIHNDPNKYHYSLDKKYITIRRYGFVLTKIETSPPGIKYKVRMHGQDLADINIFPCYIMLCAYSDITLIFQEPIDTITCYWLDFYHEYSDQLFDHVKGTSELIDVNTSLCYSDGSCRYDPNFLSEILEFLGEKRNNVIFSFTNPIKACYVRNGIYKINLLTSDLLLEYKNFEEKIE